MELRPMPLSTGIALNALKDLTALETIQHSLDLFAIQGGKLADPPLTGMEPFGAWRLESLP